MTDTFVDGEVQRIQVMLYAKTQSGKTSCLEPCAGKLARTVRQ